MAALTTNKSILSWIDEKAALVKPDEIVWIAGSEEQLEKLREEACKSGEMRKLNEDLLQGCLYHSTAPNDVARVEDRTLICSKKEEDAGPTNHWMEPGKAYEMLYAIAVSYTHLSAHTFYYLEYAEPNTGKLGGVSG